MNALRGHRRTAIALAIVAVQASQLPARAYPGDVFQNGAAATAPSSNDTAESGDAAYGVSDQGGAQYTIPIVVPPGRQGMAPSLALSYSSRSPVRGGLASGWNLGLPRIEVDTSRGRLGGVEYKTSSGARLIRVTEPAPSDAETFRAERDDSFTRYERVRGADGATVSWRARTLDGQTLYFGEASLSRDVPHEASATGVDGARWFITRSVDRFGNEVRYSYEKAWSRIRNETMLVPVDIYPTSIEWGSHADTGLGYRSHARVVFDHAAADLCAGSWVPIGASFSWRTGFPLMEGARRMTAIRVDVLSGSSWVERRRYTLRYDSEELKCRTGRSHAPLRLLTSVQEQVKSPEGTSLTLPAITFSYGRRELELTASTGARPLGSGTNAQAPQKAGGWPTLDSMLLDLDGDGRLDLLWSQPTLDAVECGVTWQRNLGDGTFAAAQEFTLPTNPWRGAERDRSDNRDLREGCSLSHQFSRAETDDLGCGLAATYTSYRFMDVTGDGRPDLVTAIDANQGRYQPTADLRLWPEDEVLVCEPAQGACRNDETGDPMRCAVSAPRPPSFAPGDDDDDGNNGCPAGMCAYPGCDSDYELCDCIPDFCSIDEQRTLSDIYSPPIDNTSELGGGGDVFWAGPGYASGGTGTEGRIAPHQNYACAQQPEEQCAHFVWRVYPNIGDGFDSEPRRILSPIPLESDRATSALGAGALAASSSWHGFLDMDGDGYMDAVFMTPFWSYSNNEPANPPESFQVFRGDGTGEFHGDANGDPYLWAAPTLPTADAALQLRARVKLSRSRSIATELGDDKLRASRTMVTLEDINGDGLPDYVDAREPLGDTSSSHFRVFYNTGNGFETSYRGSTLEVPGWGAEILPDAGENQQYVLDWHVNGQLDRGWSRDVRRMVDVDADGLLDLVVLPALQAGIRNPWTRGDTLPRLFINVGDRLVPMGATSKLNAWWPALARIRLSEGFSSTNPTWSLKTDFVDLDGDGLPEAFINDKYASYCEPDPDSYEFILPCGGSETSRTTPRDGQGMRLLRTVRNGLGAEVRFDYDPMAGGRVPHPVWVVRSMKITPGGGAPPMVTWYGFDQPVYSQDDREQWGFRGFATTRTTGPSGARTLKRFDHALDWTGPLVETRIEEASGHLASVARTSWERRTLFGGPIATLHANRNETRTCGAAQTAAQCEAAGAVSVSTTTWGALAAGIGGPLQLAHVVTAQTSSDGETIQAGSKRVTQQRLLVANPTRYWLLPLVEESFVATSATAWTQTGKTTHQWDPSQRVELATTVYADAGSPATTSRTYDLATGNQTGAQKPEQASAGLWASAAYDPTGTFVVRSTNELGHQIDATWDVATGAQLSSRGPNAKPNGAKEGWTRRIDGLGRPIEESVFIDDAAAGYLPVAVTRTVYSDTPIAGLRTTSVSQRIELTEDRWTSVSTEVDGLGRAVRTTEQVGATPLAITRHHYDAAGQRIRAELPTPQTSGTATVSWTFAYDSLGRQLQALGPDGAGQRWIYDGRWTTREDVVGPSGGTAASTITLADGFGRLVEVAEVTDDGHLAKTFYGYDGRDALSSIQDADGVVTTMQHDWKGQRISIYRGERTWRYVYDRNGRLVGTVAPVPPGANAAAYTTTIVYDALDRELSRLSGSRELDSAQLARYGAASVIRQYDGDPTDNGIGRLTNTTQPWGNTIHRYEARGLARERRLKLTLPGVGLAVDRSERVSYNALGAPREIVYADGGNPEAPTTVTFATNDRGQPATTTFGYTGQTLATYGYTAAGGVSSRVSAGMYEHAIGYDPRGRITKHDVRARLPADATLRPRVATAYEYDGSGAVESMTWGLGPTGTLAVETFAFAYDRQHQLISATGPAGYDAAFVYSDAGRVAAATVYAAANAVGVASREVTYDYGADEDLETPDKLIAPDGTTWLDLTHDRSGNTTRRAGATGTWTHYHDGFDQQREVIGPSGREVYWYDADGQRVGVAAYGTGGTLERIRWNVGATEVWYAKDGAVTKTIAQVGPARIENRQYVEHVFADHYGHTLAVLDRNGAMLAGFVYGPFGEILRQAGTEMPEVLRRFNGKEHDDKSGLVYYGYRYFDPLTLTWTQADPLYRLVPDLAWAQPRRMSAYAFSLNNSLKYVDPNGLENEDEDQYHEYMEGGHSAGDAEEMVKNNVPPDVAFALGDPRDVAMVEGLATGAAPWLPVVDAARTWLPGFDMALKGLVEGDFGGALVSGGVDVATTAVGAGVGSVAGRFIKWGVGRIVSRGARALSSAKATAFLKAATQPFNASLTEAGKALTKHPEIVGLTKPTLRKTIRTDGALNAEAERALSKILGSGTAVRDIHPRYGKIIDVTGADGYGARFYADGGFIGFLNKGR